MMLNTFLDGQFEHKNEYFIKRITIAAIGFLLALNVALAGEPSPSDQKWLTAIEKMVTEGKNTVSTPNKDRIELLKDWAKKKGYSVEVAKNDQGFRATLTKASDDKLASR
jgi:hypothetical protein